MRPTRKIQIDRSWDGEPLSEHEIVSIELEMDNETLAIRVDAPLHGDPAPQAQAGRVDRLWEHEVIELFLVGTDERYIELELGPDGHWLALKFAGIRQLVDDQVELHYSAVHEGARWRGTASIANTQLPSPILQWNAFAIHGVGEARRYLAAQPAGGESPDFHRIHDFPRW